MNFLAWRAGFCLLLVCGPAAADGYSDFTLGVAAAQRFETEDAIKSLSRALSEPDLPQHLRSAAYLARGQELLEKKDYDAAIADFSESLRLKPSSIAYIRRSAAYEGKQQLQQAIADCTSAIALQPENWRLHAMRVALYVDAKRFDDAIADYSSFIAQRPDDGELLLGRAEVFREAGQYEKAINDAKAAHGLDRGWARPYATLGFTYLAENDLSHALDSFDSLEDRDGDDPEASLIKGQMQWALGRFENAQDSFVESLGRDHKQPYALLWLSLTSSRTGKEIRGKLTAPFAAVELSRWPGPLVALYLGKSTPDAVLNTHGENTDTGDEYRCEADFFVGEWQQMRGNALEARRLLQDAGTTCVHDWRMRKLAAIDLARLP